MHCDDLGGPGREAQEEGDMCTQAADSLHCTAGPTRNPKAITPTPPKKESGKHTSFGL